MLSTNKVLVTEHKQDEKVDIKLATSDIKNIFHFLLISSSAVAKKAMQCFVCQ